MTQTCKNCERLLEHLANICSAAGVSTDQTAEELVESFRALRAQVAAAQHDIQAYRGQLGYPVPGDHNGNLTDGTLPINGIAEALSQQLAAAQDRVTELGHYITMWHVGSSENELKSRIATLERTIDHQRAAITDAMNALNSSAILLTRVVEAKQALAALDGRA